MRILAGVARGFGARCGTSATTLVAPQWQTLSPRSPNLNAYAERCVRSVKDECVNNVILFGERSLRRALKQYDAHYHAERNHQGRDNRLIEAASSVGSPNGAIRCNARLGGLLRYYYRAAA